jgi:hypothetical protein
VDTALGFPSCMTCSVASGNLSPSWIAILAPFSSFIE